MRQLGSLASFAASVQLAAHSAILLALVGLCRASSPASPKRIVAYGSGQLDSETLWINWQNLICSHHFVYLINNSMLWQIKLIDQYPLSNSLQGGTCFSKPSNEKMLEDVKQWPAIHLKPFWPHLKWRAWYIFITFVIWKRHEDAWHVKSQYQAIQETIEQASDCLVLKALLWCHFKEEYILSVGRTGVQAGIHFFTAGEYCTPGASTPASAPDSWWSYFFLVNRPISCWLCIVLELGWPTCT